MPSTPNPRTKVTLNPFDHTWVLKYPDKTFVGKTFVGIDKDSGGYPYRAHHPSSVYFFTSYEAALEYQSHFPKDSFTIHSVFELRVSLPEEL